MSELAREDCAELRVRFESAGEPSLEQDVLRLRIPTDGMRSQARLLADPIQPALVRESLLAMAAIAGSDSRRKPPSRADYLAYLAKQGKKASDELWRAQAAFLREKLGEARAEEAGLDPILSVGEAGLALEALSGDESIYARLTIDPSALGVRELAPGTSFVRLDAAVTRGLSRLRSYRRTELELSPSQAAEERQVRVPYRSLRTLWQIQAASTLPALRVALRPVDLYNLLLTLRMHKAKRSPRALRFELVPGERPRLVLEPWETLIEATGAVFSGDRPAVVRTWGRHRLGLLARLLPHTRAIEVRLVGAGLPAFWSLDLGAARLDLALSGWTDSGWSSIATFDLLAPGAVDEVLSQRCLQVLEAGPKSLDALAQELGRAREEVRRALVRQMQRGMLLCDFAQGLFVHRPLLGEPLDARKLTYRDAREEGAHRLLSTEGQVRLTKVHDLGAEGVRIEGEVEDREARRTYRASFTLDREGRTVDATCSSPEFRRSGLKEGPTVPMIALRLLYARQQAELERLRGTPEGRALIRAETRTLLRREGERASLARVTLDERQVVLRFGKDPERLRMQRLFFGSADDARAAYFRLLEDHARRGFLDSSAAENA